MIESDKVNFHDKGWYEFEDNHPIKRPIVFSSTWSPTIGKPEKFYMNVYG